MASYLQHIMQSVVAQLNPFETPLRCYASVRFIARDPYLIGVWPGEPSEPRQSSQFRHCIWNIKSNARA